MATSHSTFMKMHSHLTYFLDHLALWFDWKVAGRRRFSRPVARRQRHTGLRAIAVQASINGGFETGDFTGR